MPTLHPKSALMLRKLVGEADCGDRKYEVSLVNGHMPAVKDLTTGKSAVFDWEELTRLAIAAGISVDDEPKLVLEA